jgi:hypothetical protein
MADRPDSKPGGRVVPLPFSRLAPPRSEGCRDLGLTKLSREIGGDGRAPMGHWCSRCRGIWYSFFLETQCPVCGNRHG